MALTEKRDMLGAMIAISTFFRTTDMYERFLGPAMLGVQSKSINGCRQVVVGGSP